MAVRQPSSDPARPTEGDTMKPHDSEDLHTKRNAVDVDEPWQPVAVYPNARPPDKYTNHVPPCGVPIPWGAQYSSPSPWSSLWNNFVHSNPLSIPSGPSPGELQGRNVSSHDTTSSSTDKKNCSSVDGTPAQKHNDDIQDSISPGCYPTHCDPRFGDASATTPRCYCSVLPFTPLVSLPLPLLAQLLRSAAPPANPLPLHSHNLHSNDRPSDMPQYNSSANWNNSTFPEPNSFLSDLYCCGMQKKDTSYDSMSSAANNKKNTGCDTPIQKRNDNIQDSVSFGHYSTHDARRFGSAMSCSSVRPYGADVPPVPQYGYPTTWSGGLNGHANPEPDRNPPTLPAGRVQENASSYDSMYSASANKDKGFGPGRPVSLPQDSILPQGHSALDSTRSATTSSGAQTHNNDPNAKGDRISTTGSRQSAATGDLRKDSENVSIQKTNVVVFGETGVGKSSVINLIADEKRAYTSNDAVGCTFKHERHDITLGRMACTFWDTTGLDEASEGTVPAVVAEKNLRGLIKELARTEGIHLIIYCIRAARLTWALKRNYDLFYVGVCRRKVPIALVVTGLEHQERGMETWWRENEETLRHAGMQFDAHACVTTLDSEDQTIQNRRSESQRHLHALVLKYSRLSPWKITESFPSWVSYTLRDALKRNPSAGVPGSIKVMRKVIVCDASTNPQTAVQAFPGITALCQRLNATIGDKDYEFVQVGKRALETTLQHEKGAGMLVFYISLVGDGIPQEDVTALKTFYDIVGEESCPLLVVLRGFKDEETARKLWNDATLNHSLARAHLHFLPSIEDGQSNELNEAIEKLCIEYVEVPKPDKAGKRFLHAIEAQFSQVIGFARRAKRLSAQTPRGEEARRVKTTGEVRQPTPGVRERDGREADRPKAAENEEQLVSDVQAPDDGETTTRGLKMDDAKRLAFDVGAPDDGEATMLIPMDEWKEIMLTRLPRLARSPGNPSLTTDDATYPTSNVGTPDDGEATMLISMDEWKEIMLTQLPRLARSPGNPSLTTDDAKYPASNVGAPDDGEATMLIPMDDAKHLTSDVGTLDAEATTWGFMMTAHSPGSPPLSTDEVNHSAYDAGAPDDAEATIAGIPTDEWREIFGNDSATPACP